ncbi:MAG: T9SS type A sorting domain-containing protein [Nanoarchaeota archaeon]
MKNLLFYSLITLSTLSSKLIAQDYDSLKTVEIAKNLESKGFSLEGYIIDKPFILQIDKNDSSVTIDCPLIGEKQFNDSLMDYSFFVVFNKKDSSTIFYRNFINDYGGLSLILDDNNLSPKTYADSLKKLLKNSITHIKENKIPLEDVISEIYPNPTNGYINIKYKIKEEADVELKLYDVLGREISKSINNNIPGDYTKTFNVSALSTGVYFLGVKINSSKGEIVKTKKINIVK